MLEELDDLVIQANSATFKTIEAKLALAEVSGCSPTDRLRNLAYMTASRADETLRTIVSWARYAELFAYDERTEMFSLENPE